jgi:hypothetical protein
VPHAFAHVWPVRGRVVQQRIFVREDAPREVRVPSIIPKAPVRGQGEREAGGAVGEAREQQGTGRGVFGRPRDLSGDVVSTTS